MPAWMPALTLNLLLQEHLFFPVMNLQALAMNSQVLAAYPCLGSVMFLVWLYPLMASYQQMQRAEPSKHTILQPEKHAVIVW